MSAFRRAGGLSLGLHAALVVGLVAGFGRPAAGPVGAPGRGGKILQDVGVVTLAAPAQPQAMPPVPLPQPVAMAPSPMSAPPPLPRAITQTVPEVTPVAYVPSSPVAPSAALPPVARAPGSPGSSATTFFNVPAVGKSVVYVIDRSSSMSLDGRFDRAREQVVASLRQLPADARFQVVAYDKIALPLRIGDGGLAAATPANVAAAAAALGNMAAEGSTNHLRALQLALSLGPDVIYFLTDEDDLKATDVETVTKFNGGRVSIHALCLAVPAGATRMRELARRNRGEFRMVD